MWYRMMAIAFFTNGLGAFGMSVLTAMGLVKTHNFLYLAFWYSAGLTVSLVAFLSGKPKLSRSEIAVGGLMGLFSSVGWVFLSQAMAHDMPGYLTYPIAIGGSLSIVAAVGVLVFKERLSPYGYLGILTGVAGIALLATV